MEELTNKQKLFIEQYVVDCNATQAAIRAGYEPANARQMGYENLTKPYIREEVDRQLKLKSLNAAETVKSISDIANSRLNDFMIIRPVQSYVMEELYVTTVIAHTRKEVERLELFIVRNKLTKKQKEPFEQKITELLEKIAQDEAEVERWGDDVTRLVRGKPVVGYEAELDLVSLAKAKEAGRIKSLKHTKEGVQVELYAADAALRDLAKVHGLLVDKVQHSGKDGGPMEIMWRDADNGKSVS